MKAQIISKNTLHIFCKEQFNLDAIMYSGQVFRFFFDQEKNVYTVYSGCEKAELLEKDDSIVCNCTSADYFYNYFDLDLDYNLIANNLEKDFPTIKKIFSVYSKAKGIRILKGDFLETVISFIISANNNIKRFSKTINSMCLEFGENNAFPSFRQLKKISTEDFRRLGCGYRAEYLTETIKLLEKIDFNILNALDNNLLREQLLKLKGVGRKVADCIMLFCFNRLDVFPVDTWIKKASIAIDEKELSKIINNSHAGIIQQYIFYYLQHAKLSL